jgi:Holliday junction resolvasome RuvABC DNA-binding subunit
LIVLTLTGKLVTGTTELSSSGGSEGAVVSALVGLGYQEKLAKAAVESALKNSPSLSESELLRQSLSNLSSARK